MEDNYVRVMINRIERFTKKAALRSSRALNWCWTKHRLTTVLILTALVALWYLPMLISGSRSNPDDFDYFAQVYEAIRQSILTYHQFPWMNAWVGGGVPLYANPQAGVFSIQTLLVLVFGTVYGLKVSVVLLQIASFWSMFLLVRKGLKGSLALSISTSFIWVCNGFFVSHIPQHYTFTLFGLLPLLLYLILYIRNGKNWLWLGLVVSAMILSSFHYAVIMSAVVLVPAAIVRTIMGSEKRHIARLWIYTAGTIFLLCAHRMYYTIQYVSQFPQIPSPEVPNKVTWLIKSFLISPTDSWIGLTSPFKIPANVNYGWYEYSVFCGYATVLAGIICVSAVVVFLIRRRFRLKGVAIDGRLCLGVLAFLIAYLIAMGDFAKLSPYNVMRHLPIVSDLRVASRWLLIALLAGLVSMVWFVRNHTNGLLKISVTGLLVIGALEVYIVGFGQDRFILTAPSTPKNTYGTFEQYDNFPHDAKFTLSKANAIQYDASQKAVAYWSTKENLGEVRGYEPIDDTRYSPTLRCGINHGCGMVLTQNARIIEWSPNHIRLLRLSSGPIELNMNPSSYWVDGSGIRLFPNDRVIEVQKKFLVSENTSIIDLYVKP